MNFENYDLNNLERKCVKEVAEISRKVASDGIVLLKNDNVLPFDKDKTLSIFGRTQIDYVKSGTGSGGLVNVEYSVNILDGLKGRININTELVDIYKSWLKDNPFDVGEGWAKEPWSQKEMPVTDEMCKNAADKSDYALVVIGRTAGEDRDNFAGEGSYLLTNEEENLIATVSRHFDKVCVALNVGNIIDMKWVEKYNIPCVLYSWQGGQEGGNAFADVLLGDVNPSGRLSDTIAYDITDYPSTKNFGNDNKNIYQEDIYVGYRYFETFAKDKVMYPFGFGLSYTDFEYSYNAKYDNEKITVTANVKNVGKVSGKTVVQVYFNATQGRLGKPLKQLIRYQKTSLINPNESENITLEFPINEMASYDDKETFSYILEQGEYIIFAGDNVRDAKEVLELDIEEKTVKQLRQNLAPIYHFDRIKPIINGDKTEISYEAVTTRNYDINERIKEHIAPQMPHKNMGITLKDVADKKANLDDFVMQLSKEELTYIVKGEGMNSPKVTGGTGSCFGGVTDELLAYGIPPVCCTDGPSGIRMDTGHKATLMPNGTCLACTWDNALNEKLHSYLGVELRANNVDILLGGGINIHRNPLNGRNFEYFSEDPYLTGTMGAACTNGMSNAGVITTIKHFACNSQESARYISDSVVSERALREIYLKPFEIAVKEGKAKAIMTSYNKINGTYAASNYDLCTSILKDEWGYDGFVMTDWWADVGDGERNKFNLNLMVEAQNDVYMVTKSSKDNEDDLIESVNNGTLDLTYLRKCAKNILGVIINLPAIDRKPIENVDIKREDYHQIGTIENMENGKKYDIKNADALELEFTTEGSDLAQYVINIFDDDKNLTCALTKGATDEPKTVLVSLPKYEGEISLNYSSVFKYMRVTLLKKNV